METLTRLSVALGIGLLVGLERGWHQRSEAEHKRAAGFRTFAITGLLGGILGILSLTLGGIVLGLGLLAFTIGFLAFHWLEARLDGDISVTSVIAGMLTCALGAFAAIGEVSTAIAAAVAMTVLLALHDPLHRWLASITAEEIRAILILLAMTFLLLPVLPNRAIDPWGTVNPHEVWLFAVLIAAISFGGYVAVRLLGDRIGVLMAAVAGGLASSTATTLTLARIGQEHPQSARLLSAGILLAGGVMAARVAALAIALNPGLLPLIAPPLLAAGLVLAAGCALFLFGSAGRERPRLEISNPLELATALKMAAFIVAVLLASELLRRWLGPVGVYLVAAVSGIADVDAVTISMSRLGGGDLNLDTAARAILIAVAVNTASKSIMAAATGGMRIGVTVGGVSALAIAVGFAVVALYPLV